MLRFFYRQMLKLITTATARDYFTKKYFFKGVQRTLFEMIFFLLEKDCNGKPETASKKS